MKVLHAVHNFPPEFVGGTEAYVRALAIEQRRQGLDAIVLAGSGVGGERLERTCVDEIDVHRVHRDVDTERYSIDLRHPGLRAIYADVLDRERPDVVHVHHYFNLGVPLVQDAAARGIPAVVTLHDYLVVCPRFFLLRPDGGFCGEETPVPRDRCIACCRGDYGGNEAELDSELELRRRFFAAELGAAAAVLTPSEHAAAYLRNTGILPMPELRTVPLGLLRRLEPAPAVPDPDGRLRLVAFGNVAPVKGVDRLLAALLALDEARRRRVSVAVIGRATDAALEARLAPMLAALGGTREGGYDVGRLERLPAEADVAVFAGDAAETYSLVVDEALSLGLAVIVSDRGAAAERAGAAAVVVRTGDTEGLTAAIRDLVDDPARVVRMRSAAAARRFTIEDGAKELLAIYQDARQEFAGRANGARRLDQERLADDRLRLADRVTVRLHAGVAPTAPEFDRRFRFLPLKPFSAVPGGRVAVLAPHPDDEVIGCGGAIALHAARGDRVVVVHLTDGAGGDAARDAAVEIARVRKAEARAAGEVLGVREFESLDFPDGGLRPGGAFEAGLSGILARLSPDVVYAPSPFEHHPDHRATTLLLAGALRDGPARPRVILYEVNEPQQASYLLDVTPVFERKREALERFGSQRASMDIVRKTLDANRARTVNVDLPEVAAAEAYVEVHPERLDEWASRVTELRRVLEEVIVADGERSDGTKVETARAADAKTAPVSAVISCWNKKEDVRANLDGLRRQTLKPAEIIVVDNASKDGTAEMIRAEYPEVRLITTEHDRVGACETFNMGFKAATQPFLTIMDDDVVAPPEWLERLYTRMLAEPETTAMISSKVIEPGMPDAFIHSPEVNRERYMSTFRGCATLTRTSVLRDAGYYDEKFFIYGNERDLAARVLNLGYRILQFPQAEIFHQTPFGLKAGKRSLYYHVRNFWLYAFKNCSVGQIVKAAWVLGLKGLGVKKDKDYAIDATGTIGIDRSIKETEGGLWIAIKATLAAFALIPYCLKHRRVCRSPDFKPPVS